MTKTIKKRATKQIRQTKTKLRTAKLSSGLSNKKQPAILTLELLNKIIADEYPKLKDIDAEQLQDKITGMKKSKMSEKQSDSFNYIKSLVSALLGMQTVQTANLKSKKIPEFMPPNGDKRSDKDDMCITSKYNLKKIQHSGSGAFGSVYKFKDGKRNLAVKVVDISRVNENTLMKCWGGAQFYTVAQMEKEAAISKHLGELGIGPQIHDVYYCTDKTGKIKYYYVMDYMNRGSLIDYMTANNITVLPDKYVRQIVAKLDKMHAAGYIHDDLHTENILVNEPRKGQLEFYISDFGLSNKLTAKLDNETRGLYDELKYDGNRAKKTLELQTEYLAKLILREYSVPALGK